MHRNCQCNQDFYGAWMRQGKRSVVIWRCVSCDAWSGRMSNQAAVYFREQYFAVPKNQRVAWIKQRVFRHSVATRYAQAAVNRAPQGPGSSLSNRYRVARKHINDWFMGRGLYTVDELVDYCTEHKFEDLLEFIEIQQEFM